MTMKNLRLSALILLLSTLLACQKDQSCRPATGINGLWIWVNSIGGFAGGELTPATAGYTQSLAIDDFTYRAFVNDSLVFESQYELEIRPDSAWGTNRYIVLEKGGEMAVKISAAQLELYELCADCFDHTYKRQ